MSLNINNEKYERFITEEELDRLEKAKKEIEAVMKKHGVFIDVEEHHYFDPYEDYASFDAEAFLAMESVEDKIMLFEANASNVRENKGAKEFLKKAISRTPNVNNLTISDLTTLELVNEGLLLDNFDNYRDNTPDRRKIYQKRFVKNHNMRFDINPNALEYSLLIEFDTKSKQLRIPSYDRVNLPKEIYHKNSTVNQVFLTEEIVAFYNKLIEIGAVRTGKTITYREDEFLIDYDLFKSLKQSDLNGLIRDVCSNVNQFEYSHTKNELGFSYRNDIGVICLYRNNQSDLLIFDEVKYDDSGLKIDDYRAFVSIIVERDINNPSVLGKITKTDEVKVINTKDF